MPKTGYCSVGHHEGMRVPGPSGKLNKTCTFIETCSCDHPNCHKFYDRMFAEAGLPRVPVDNSGYEAEHVGLILPEPVVVEAAPILSNNAPELPPDTLESVAPGIVPPLRRREFTQTQTGRAARGELESQVNAVCIAWAVSGEQPCTPAYVSTEIARTEGIKPPSVGAIDAVFKRWKKISYAKIDRKPTRFTGFTEFGIKLGLDELKRRSKLRG